MEHVRNAVKNNRIPYVLTHSRQLLMMLLGSVLLFESLFYLLSLKGMLLVKNILFWVFFPLKAEIFDLLIGQDHQQPYKLSPRHALLMPHGPN